MVELGVELISGPEIYKEKSETKKASHITCTAMMSVFSDSVMNVMIITGL